MAETKKKAGAKIGQAEWTALSVASSSTRLDALLRAPPANAITAPKWRALYVRLFAGSGVGNVLERPIVFVVGESRNAPKEKAGRLTRLFYQSANDSVQRCKSSGDRCNALVVAPRSDRNSFSRLLLATGASFVNASQAESSASITVRTTRRRNG